MSSRRAHIIALKDEENYQILKKNQGISIGQQINKRALRDKLSPLIFQLFLLILLYKLSKQMEEKLRREDSYSRLHTKAVRLSNRGSRESVMLASNLRQAIDLAISLLNRQIGSHKRADECSIQMIKAQNSRRSEWNNIPQGKVIGFCVKSGNWSTYRLQLDDDEYGAHIYLQLYGISYSIYYFVRFPEYDEKNRQKHVQVQEADPYVLIQSQSNRFQSEIRPVSLEIQHNQLAIGAMAIMAMFLGIMGIFAVRTSS